MYTSKTAPLPPPGIALPPAVEVEVTVTVDGLTKTFRASGNTDGSPWTTARALTHAVAGDARTWTLQVEGGASR